MDDLLANPPELPLLIYDSECPLCERFGQSLKMVMREKSPTLLSLHHPELQSVFPTLRREDCAETIHYIDGKAQVYIGSAAVSELIKLSPTVEKFSWLIDSAMGQKAVDFFYQSANRMRDSLLKRCGGCRKS